MSVVLPINVSEVMDALENLLKNDTRLAGAVIERATQMNKVPQVNGWIGLYRALVTYRARTLGKGPGYRKQHIDLVILVQHSHPNDPRACEASLEELLVNVMSAILTDESLGGTVETLDDVLVRYEAYEMKDQSYMQTARVFVTGLVDVRALS